MNSFFIDLELGLIERIGFGFGFTKILNGIF